MSGIVVYGSFYGTTKEIADKIASALEIKAYSAGELSESIVKSSDFIIIGSAIQKYKFHPDIEIFIKMYKNILIEKKLFLFLSCFNPVIAERMQLRFPGEIRGNIMEGMVIGGRVKWEKLPLFDKLLLKYMELVTHVKIKGFDTISDKRINKFIEKVRKRLNEQKLEKL